MQAQIEEVVEMENLSYSQRLARGIGYLTISEVGLIKQMAHLLPANAICVNIGTGSATSIIAVLEERPELIIYCVDINPDNGMSQLHETGFIRNIIQITGDSKVVEWLYGDIQWCLVDGGHLRDEILGDLQMWYPRMAENSIMLFDDYGDGAWPSVKEVVDFFARQLHWQQLGLVDNLIAFRVKRGGE